jgi:Helicase conserved C-terminal domain
MGGIIVFGARADRQGAASRWGDALEALAPDKRAALTTRRPDLAEPAPPAAAAALAARAMGPTSLVLAVRMLDARALQLTELLAVLGPVTNRTAVIEAAGAGLEPDQLDAALAEVAALAVALPGPDGEIFTPPGLAALFDGRPGGLGPPVEQLMAGAGVWNKSELAAIAATLGLDLPQTLRKDQLTAEVTRALSDPDLVSAALEAAGPAARELLAAARRSHGRPIALSGGTRYPGPYNRGPRATAERALLDRGLLFPDRTGWGQAVIPREAELALRGGVVFSTWPTPPPAPRTTLLPDAERAAQAAALRTVTAAEAIAARLAADPLLLTKTGTLRATDQRQFARDLGVPEAEVAVIAELLLAAGLIRRGGPEGQRLALTTRADPWLAGSRAARWAHLALTWRATSMPVEDHLDQAWDNDRDGPRPRPLESRWLEIEGPWRHTLLACLPEGGRAVETTALVRAAAWRWPLLWSGQEEATQAPVVAAATLLGLAARDGTRVSRAAVTGPWVDVADADALAAAAAPGLPDGENAFVVAGDHTVTATQPLTPAVAAELASFAERTSSGSGGTGTWRVTATTLRAALDRGRTAAQILGFLRAHSRTPLPQSLEYLVDDTGRRHGRLRVGPATTYLRGEPAAIAHLVASATGRHLGLRETSPGSAVTSRPEKDVLTALRKLGEAPVPETPDGQPRSESRSGVRHPDPIGRSRYGPVNDPEGSLGLGRLPEEAGDPVVDLTARTGWTWAPADDRHDP